MGVRLSVYSREREQPIRYEFEQERVVIGRGASCDVQLPHRGVSQHHAVIRSQFPDYVIEDVGSTNGTRVNGVPLIVAKPKTLKSFDSIEITGILLTFESSVPISLPTSAERTCSLARRLLREVLFDSGTFHPPRLIVETGPSAGLVVELPSDGMRVLLGRDPDCDIPIDDPDVSREHLSFERDDDGVLVRDLGSKNGFLLNQRKVLEKRLRHMDEIHIGMHRIRFEDKADAEVQHIQSEPDLRMDVSSMERTEVLPRFELARAPAPHSSSTPADVADAHDAAARPADPSTSTPARASHPAVQPSMPPSSPGASPSRAGRASSADALIYAMALLVFAISLVSLFALLSAGD
jgi:pSer/pThr/pTyr-binding forkhead associated (FHA) protein